MKVGKKLNCGTIVIVCLLAILGTVKAKTIYVNASADPDGDGTSWQTAYNL